jgi:uncharacterized protein
MQPLLQDYRYYDIFSAVFKISDKCNLECSYCYRENALKNEKLHHMPLEVIDRTLDSLLNYKHWLYARYGWSKMPSLYFIWHGGEPLIIGINQINKILNIQKKYKEKGLDIINCIQTNGTIINKSFLDIFQKEHFRVGISIDGPESVHNKHRVYRNGVESFQDTYQGIQMLKKLKYPWSVISVITNESIGQEEAIFEFFISEKPFEVDFTPAFFYETNISLSPENYAQFMIKMFDLWVSEKNPPFDIRFFRDVLYILGYYDTEKDQIICELAGKCHRNISILTNGDVYSCECLNAKPSNKIGNILSETFIEIVQSESFFRLSQITNTYCMDCLSCEVFFVCKAGCYNRRLPNENEKSRLDFYCDARKKIIHHIMDWIENSSAKTLQPLKIQNMKYTSQLTDPLIFNRSI